MTVIVLIVRSEGTCSLQIMGAMSVFQHNWKLAVCQNRKNDLLLQNFVKQFWCTYVELPYDLICPAVGRYIEAHFFSLNFSNYFLKCKWSNTDWILNSRIQSVFWNVTLFFKFTRKKVRSSQSCYSNILWRLWDTL